MSRASPVVDLRGAGRLVADLTVLVTDVVETMHHNIARRPGPLGRPTLAPTRGITGLVYRSVRGVTRIAARTIDAVLEPLASLAPETSDWPGRDAIVGALNGVLGDHLEASGNPLAIAMQLRIGAAALRLERDALAAEVPAPRSRIVVMVHGLCMTDAAWSGRGHDLGAHLARDLDATTIRLRYNSGRHVSTNGAAFARMLEALVAQWPVPVREIVLIGHSMGGLVIRSACLDAAESGHAWLRALRATVFLGTPHRGAPLERGGHGADMLFRASPYTVAFAKLGRLRSAGITDLRHGFVHDSQWQGRDRFAHPSPRSAERPLPRGARALLVAGSLSRQALPDGRRPRGDGLVPVASALGIGKQADDGGAPNEATLLAARGNRWRPSSFDAWIAYGGTGHFDLLASPSVYRAIRRWLLSGRS